MLRRLYEGTSSVAALPKQSAQASTSSLTEKVDAPLGVAQYLMIGRWRVRLGAPHLSSLARRLERRPTEISNARCRGVDLRRKINGNRFETRRRSQ